MNTVITRHFGDDSSDAVQHKVRQIVRDVSVEMQKELRAELLSEDETNPLAKFHRIQLALSAQQAKAQAGQMQALNDKLEEYRLELERLRAQNEKLEEIAAVEEKGTAKGRTYEEEVAEALEAIAIAQGDDAEAVGDRPEAGRKTGDVVVAIDGCSGPARGRIVFEAKNAKMSRPEALRELDRALTERNAEFAVLVVAAEDKVPARMLPLREYNGDKMVVAYDPEDGPLGLQVAYSLARARVLLRRADGEGIDAEAVRATVERALQELGEVQRIKQQLTASKTAVDKAAEIVDGMASAVKANLAEIQALVAATASTPSDTLFDAA
jgi:phage host-nuclease inhibitor protein Gam